MRALIVSSTVCYPPSAGNRIRMLNLMVRLARRHEVTFLCRGGADAAEELQCREHLAGHGIDTVVVNDPVPPKSGVRFGLQLAANLLSPLPYSATLHDSEPLRHAVLEQASRRKVDLIQFEWFAHARGIRKATGIPTVVSAHDVVSVLWQRHWETEANPFKRLYIRQQWRKFERLEQQVYGEISRLVAASPVDAALFRSRYGVDHVEVIDNGVDLDYFGSVQAERVPNQILFLGTLESRPNLDGIRWFLAEVFPRLRAAEPTAELCIVGRKPPEWLQQQARSLPGVKLQGDVADVRPFLGRCGVMVVPLRIGGGSRIKILEALATGMPVVSTRVGAEGLALHAGEHYVAADMPDTLADALAAAIRDPHAVQAQAARGRQVVRQHYDWDNLADQLGEVWESCAARRERPQTTQASV